MKSRLLRALSLVAPIIVAGCNTTTVDQKPSAIEKEYYAGCATNPPENPVCGHH